MGLVDSASIHGFEEGWQTLSCDEPGCEVEVEIPPGEGLPTGWKAEQRGSTWTSSSMFFFCPAHAPAPLG
jgi:hypothetical protein